MTTKKLTPEPAPDIALSSDKINSMIPRYLDHGFRQDVISLESVRYQAPRINARFLVKEHFLPSDGMFHLSGIMATLCASKVGMVLAFLECDLQHKPYDLFLVESNLQFRKISRDLDFLVTLEVIKRVTRRNQNFLRFMGSINEAFELSGTLAFKTKALTDDSLTSGTSLQSLVSNT